MSSPWRRLSSFFGKHTRTTSRFRALSKAGRRRERKGSHEEHAADRRSPISRFSSEFPCSAAKIDRLAHSIRLRSSWSIRKRSNSERRCQMNSFNRRVFEMLGRVLVFADTYPQFLQTTLKRVHCSNGSGRPPPPSIPARP